MPFKKGQSGNPSGRPPGAGDRRQLVREYLRPEAPKLIQKAIEMALDGDAAMMRACLDKLIPNARQSTRTNLSISDSCPSLGDEVVKQVCSGRISLEEGNGLLDLLEKNAQLYERLELSKRLDALEASLGSN